MKVLMDDYSSELLKKGRTYFDILLYNCTEITIEEYEVPDVLDITKMIKRTKEIIFIDTEKLSIAFDDLISVYEKLFDFSLGLSGYQFIGLFLQNGFSDIAFFDLQIAYLILSIGFLISLFDVLLCFITIEYLRGCRNENVNFIIIGIKKYTPFFKLSDKIIYLNCICFLIPINIIIHNSLEFPFAIGYNCVSIILCIIGILSHKTIIIDKQIYNNGTCKRKIYT